MKISACVIVKNEEKNIGKWLSCVAAVADEIIVVDTGSTDKTVEIVKNSNAKLYHFSWCNDFSAAKNYAIDKARGDWIVFLDADEYFTEESQKKLRKVVNGYNRNKKVGGIMCRLTSIDIDNHERIINSMLQVRIFRNILDIRYQGKIHENIYNKNKKRAMVFTKELEIYHTGYSSSLSRSKAERNIKLLQEQWNSEGESDELILQMMDAYNSLAEYDEAIKYGRMAISKNINGIGMVGHSYEIVIGAMLSAHYPVKEIYDTMQEAESKYPDEPAFPLEHGYLLWLNKDYIGAEKYLQKGLKLRTKLEEAFSRGDGLTDNSRRLIHLAYEALGGMYFLKGNVQQAAEMYAKGIASYKYNPVLLRGLYKCIADCDDIDIIQMINSYYDRKKDGDFIIKSLSDMASVQVYLYFIKYVTASNSIYSYLKLCKYGSAAVEVAHELRRCYNFSVAAAKLLKMEDDNNINVLLPARYSDVLHRKINNSKDGLAVGNIVSQADRSDLFLDTPEKPLVSIMIPTYNRPILFERTFKSALAQTYENVEIIVNDNSTDNRTEQLMKKYLTDRRVRYYRNREAKSKEDNFVPFEHQARGSMLQWCMDDDLLAPDKLTTMVQVLRDNPGIALVTSMRNVIDINDNIIKQDNRLGITDKYALYSGRDIGRALLIDQSNFIGEPSTVLFRRNDLIHHYWHAESKGLLAISDIAMWLELLERGDCVIFRDPLSSYRCHDQQEGQQPDVILLSRIEWAKLIEEYYGKKIFLSTEKDYITAMSSIYHEYQANFINSANLEWINLMKKCKNYDKYIECMENIGNVVTR